MRDHQAVLYRQSLDLPYVNRRDSRMVPQTLEGYTLRGKASSLAYAAGYLSDIKTRDSDRTTTDFRLILNYDIPLLWGCETSAAARERTEVDGDR